MPGGSGRLVELSIDVLIVLGCTFVLAWTWRVEPGPGGQILRRCLPRSPLGELGVVLDIIGLVIAVFLALSRPRGERVAIRLAGLALRIATVGDAGMSRGLELRGGLDDLGGVVVRSCSSAPA